MNQFVSKRPNPLPFFIRWRSNLISVPLFSISTAFCGSCSLFVSLFDRKGSLQHRIARIWAWSLVLFTGCKLKVEGAENFHKSTHAVYAANHTSYMDTPVIFSALPFQFRILARKPLFRIPFIGWHLHRSGQIQIDTDNPSATLASLGFGLKTLRAGISLFVFPEGGRTLSGNLRDFLPGAAYLAIRAKVPLVPIALVGIYDLLPMHTHHFYPGPLILRVGEPIDTAGYTLGQLSELNQKLKSAIQNLLSKD
jgi:1-acyl-sn-glycerol-3-phosphate acyltransferase